MKENPELPMVNLGDMMPSLSPCVDADFSRVSVEIPKSKPSRAITKINELTYENGYDLDGEIGPFLGAVEGEREWDEVDEDGELPADMCAGSDSGAVESATISKGGNEYFSDHGSREYGEGVATGRWYYPFWKRADIRG